MANRLGNPWQLVGFLVLAPWTLSLAVPVFSTCRPGYDHVGGWFLLLFGWFGVFVFMPAWLANIFILAVGGVLAFGRRPPIWLGVLAGGFAATAWWWKEWQDDTGAVPICHYHAGYWLWLASAAVALIAPIAMRWIKS